MEKIKLSIPTPEDQAKARKFADDCYLSNKDEYARRNQSVGSKVKLDNANGKLAEILVHRYIQTTGVASTDVDFKIYKKEKKSYAADLFLLNEKGAKVRAIHIKSCMETKPFPISWSFQPNDPIVSNPREHDYIALVVFPLITFTDQNGIEQIYNSLEGYLYFKNAINLINLYREPVKKELKKKVIYEEDL